MPRTSHRVADLEVAVPADPAVFHTVRDLFAAWLGGWAPEATELRDDLVVVLSELLANAVAAAPGPASILTMRASCADDDVVVLEVSNPVAPWIDAATRWDLDDPLRRGGRGLLIVQALVDDVEVVHDVFASETTLRCLRRVSTD